MSDRSKQSSTADEPDEVDEAARGDLDVEVDEDDADDVVGGAQGLAIGKGIRIRST